MNRSQSKIRHMQQANVLLEQRRMRLMEQPTGDTQTNTMITDIKKFANDNGFLARNNDTTFYKKFTKFQMFLMVYQNLDVQLCVSKNTKAANECDVNNTTYKNTNWNLDTFTSTVKQYMV